jgi:hypothetical protein
VLRFLQDNRVSDHRVKINFDLQSFLGGKIDDAIQVRQLLLMSFFPSFFRLPGLAVPAGSSAPL